LMPRLMNFSASSVNCMDDVLRRLMDTLFYHNPDPVGHRPTRQTPQLPP